MDVDIHIEKDSSRCGRCGGRAEFRDSVLLVGFWGSLGVASKLQREFGVLGFRA